MGGAELGVRRSSTRGHLQRRRDSRFPSGPGPRYFLDLGYPCGSNAITHVPSKFINLGITKVVMIKLFLEPKGRAEQVTKSALLAMSDKSQVSKASEIL